MISNIAVSPEELLARGTGSISDLIYARAVSHPDRIALQQGDRRVSYADLDNLMNRFAAALQKSDLACGDVVAICASALSIEFVAAFFGATRVGLVPAPLPLTVIVSDLIGMISDSGAKLVLVDGAGERILREVPDLAIPRRSLEEDGTPTSMANWILADDGYPTPVQVKPEAPFNIIYSSGSTGSPKGIVHSHQLRWLTAKFGKHFAYGASSVTVVATPPAANLTIGHLTYYLFGGGMAVLMPKYDARGFLELAARVRATHAFMVNVQYKRILDLPEFDKFDLSCFRVSVFGGSVSTPEFKREMLRRWPGEIIEMYAMSEGGGRTLLYVRRHPEKIHTIGKVVEGFDIRILKDDGSEAVPGEVGELVGRSDIMMNGYHNNVQATREIEWRDEYGRRYFRMGDLATYDEDGFLILRDRKRDMIVSGGANVYPSDIERVLLKHATIQDAAVVGAPSDHWGETPVAFVVLHPGSYLNAEEVRAWANERLGKMQRIAALEILDELPRTGPDKIAKPQLRTKAIALIRRASECSMENGSQIVPD